MEHVVLQVFELLGVVLGVGVVATRVIPELRRFATAVYITMFLYNGLRQYLKRKPGKTKSIQQFVVTIVDHYLKTHPEGKKVAKATDLDEKTNQKQRELFLQDLNNLNEKLTSRPL